MKIKGEILNGFFFYCKRCYFLKYSTKEIMQNIDKLEYYHFLKKLHLELSFCHKRLVFSYSLFPDF